ncbi:MAG: acyl-CoA thioesterase [Spirochaetaceae bacterium]|jgi:acyl-CoA thioester hydrolase|nr:acyl-CoA thioesterase [Spirochaetaceae bacterium]
MFSVTISPRVGETDALGHINNCAIPAWFEHGRTPLFRIFDPNLDFTRETWRLVMVHSDYDYVNQLFCNSNVEVKTWISRIGGKSFSIGHEAWQGGRLCVKGGVTLVYYNFITQMSEPIPTGIREQLERHLIPCCTGAPAPAKPSS